MLKWTVYGKKNQEVKIAKELETEDREPYTNGPYNTRQVRRSLDAQTLKKSKKPTRYQRRSLGSTVRKNNLKTVDKENINYIGNTPNYFKEGFVSKKAELGFALKDVSNVTPNSNVSVNSKLQRKKCYMAGSKEAIPPDLPPTPPSYSRKIREAKKRKLEMSSESNSEECLRREKVISRSERRKEFSSCKSTNVASTLSHSQSEPSLNDLSERLSASRCSYRNSIALAKELKANLPISTTKTSIEGMVEIQYDEDIILNCIEYSVSQKPEEKLKQCSTIPIFGHHIFTDNPLYFNKPELRTDQLRPMSRVKQKSTDTENSFKTPSADKNNLHALVSEACSPITLTPLSVKLAALRFSAMSTHTKSQMVVAPSDITDCFAKMENPFTMPLRDDETSTEMENKFILCRDSITNVTESTVSTTEMGDITLEQMIEDIIKSTKKVKDRRKVLKNARIKEQNSDKVMSETTKHVFIKSQAENKVNLIREAKYVSLSRENSISPKNSPNKNQAFRDQRCKEIYNSISRLPMGSFILDENREYNEREVKTPEGYILNSKEIKKDRSILERSQSLHTSYTAKKNLDCLSSESTPDLCSSLKGKSNLRLRRQKGIRRKKSTVSNDSSWRRGQPQLKSILTLEAGIPSPCSTEAQNMSICDPLSSSYNCVIGPAFNNGIRNNNSSPKSIISQNNLELQQSMENQRTRELFGLTLENGIPSPITPVTNLKRPSCNLSEERAYKSSKLDEEYVGYDVFTPIIEHKSSRRCLTFSPEEGSINSSEEKRRSIASNRLERSCDRFHLLKATIDLEVIVNNDAIDVHVIRCRDLQRSCGKIDGINAYAKVVISGVNATESLSSQRSIFQRTSVVYGKREPEFQRHLKLPLHTAVYDHHMLHVSVWHRDKVYRRSEFLGCVSFPLKDAIKDNISGTYFLQSQVSGRNQSAHSATPAHTAGGSHPRDRCLRDPGERVRVTTTVEDTRKMATDNVDGTSTNDDTKDSHNDRGMSSNGPTCGGTGLAPTSIAAALQKEADEHLFLRYLELDPPEDPAAPKRPQRNGRTPFTNTRKLVRGTTGGFGFTLVWTRPPRVERVAAGGSAERAGLRAGDYIVFVGTKNVVTADEEEVRNLVKSAGPTLQIETYRKVPQNGASAKPRLSHVNITPLVAESASPPGPQTAPRSPRAAPASPAPAARPPTACSSTSQSIDRRKLHLPQVTFSKEVPGLTTDGRKRTLLAVVAREQSYATSLQFGLVRFVSPLAERADLIVPSDHQLLFQNIEEILRLSEDILDQVVQEDGELHTSTVVAVYLQKTPVFLSLYRKYCLGLKRADCVLVKKSKDPSGAFSRFCTSPPIPRRRPDITSLVHKPLEQFRELLRLMRTAVSANGAGPYEQLEKKQLQVIVDQLQNGYQDVTAGSGLMGLAGDGKPLLSVSDLESRLVFTRCKPFVLSTGGRQWIFGGELSRVEGRTVKPYWALLFTDLLLFATVSRDRVLFVTEEPVPLSTISDVQYNVRKKVTEFRLTLGRSGGESPLVSCTPRTLGRARTIVLRAPSIDLKAVWQSLLQRQIYRAHTMTGTPLGSPLDSPDPQLTFSLATLDSQQRQTRRSSAEASGTGAAGSTGVDGCLRSNRSRGSSLHLQRWMTQLPESDEMDKPDTDLETWSIEELRKRSQELNLLDVAEIVQKNLDKKATSSGGKKETDHSPSKSSNSGSQITVRTSPVVVDKIPVCRQCHQKCVSKPNSPLVSQKGHTTSVKVKQEVSSQNSNSNKSSNSICSANCGNRKPKNFSHVERKGAMAILRPEDAPKAALKVIDSIEQSQKMLKSKSYELKTDSPILNRSVLSQSRCSNNKSQLEAKLSVSESGRSPSPCSSSRNHSPLSTSHTTCSSIVFNSSNNDLRMSNSNIANQVQCVIAQERYLNEVKCVENVNLSKNKLNNNTHSSSPTTARREQVTRQKAEKVLNKVLGMNIITKRENIGKCLKTSAVFLEDDSIYDDSTEVKIERGMRRSPKMGISAVTKMNGDINKTENIRVEDLNANLNKNNDPSSDDELELGPLMLMGLSAINPTAHLMRVEPFQRQLSSGVLNNRPGCMIPAKSESPVPNIAIVPPTPEYNSINKNVYLPDDSPDSPLPEDPPYVSLKRYGTMSSLERFPSDETDDGTVRVSSQEPELAKNYNAGNGPTGGIMGWTARAGSFVVEKMNIFSYTEAASNAAIPQKPPSFLERCLGVGDWKSGVTAEEAGTETGEGSGASGEDAWGTPSSGDLSDNLQDSEHGTLSSPTKSSSSYAGDDDTDLMMDELLMAPTMTGPTTLRPLLPRRRLEPLLEEDCSDSDSEDNKPTPTNPEIQGSTRGLFADNFCDAPRLLLSASELGARGEIAAVAQLPGRVPSEEHAGGDVCVLTNSPDKTPTNERPSMLLQYASRGYVEGRGAGVGAGTAGGGFARGESASSASTPSTLERTAIHCPATPPTMDTPMYTTDSGPESLPASEETKPEVPPAPVTPPEQRLSPRAEMRLALDQGKDMLADQETRLAGVSDPWSWRAACQRSLLRRVASADAVTLCRPQVPLLGRRTAPHTTSRNSVYAWKAPESEKVMEMEQLAQAEVQTMRSRTRSLCQNGKILGFLRRRASSDSPRRELPSLGAPRPFSPRRSTEKQMDKRFCKQVSKRRQSCSSIGQI